MMYSGLAYSQAVLRDGRNFKMIDSSDAGFDRAEASALYCIFLGAPHENFH